MSENPSYETTVVRDSEGRHARHIGTYLLDCARTVKLQASIAVYRQRDLTMILSLFLRCIFSLGICSYHHKVGLHMGPNNLCYVTRHFLFFPYVPMSLL